MAAATRRLVDSHHLRALPFVGLSMQGRTDFGPRCVEVLPRLPPGPIEWMVHPRVPDGEFARIDPRSLGREVAARAELAALVGLGRAVRAGQQPWLRPSSYAEIEEASANAGAPAT
jgi:hypothetical protein